MIDLRCGDALEVLKTLPDESVQMCVTSPPYYELRDYHEEGQIGLEKTPELYIARLVSVFQEVWRVLRKDGTLWLNIGDSYAGSSKGRGSDHGKAVTSDNEIPATNVKLPGYKNKDMIGIPWMLAFALRSAGWYLRNEIIWFKTNPMAESVKDRCTKSHEQIFLLTKSARYYYDYEAILEPAAYDGRKKTFFSGSPKYKGSGLVHEFGHERWPRTMKKFEDPRMAASAKNLAHHKGYIGSEGKELFYRNAEDIPARNKRDVWMLPSQSYKGAHFATFPEALVKPCVLAGSRQGDTVIDPFSGAGTVGVVCQQFCRDYIGIDLSSKYVEMSRKRIATTQPGLVGL